MYKSFFIVIVAFLVLTPGKNQRDKFLLIKNVNVVWLRDNRIEKTDVLVRNGAIDKIGTITDARRVTSLDAEGKYLIPGLWDMHTHIVTGGRQALGSFLKYGVTSVRDMGGNMDTLRKWRAESNMPTVYAAGAALESGSFISTVKRVDSILVANNISAVYEDFMADFNPFILSDTNQVSNVLHELASAKVALVKGRNFENKNVYLSVLRHTRKRGLMYAGHSPPPGVSLEEASEAGHGSIEHMYYLSSYLQNSDSTHRASLYSTLKGNKTWIVPTITTECLRTSPDSLVLKRYNDIIQNTFLVSLKMKARFKRDMEIQLLENKVMGINDRRDEFAKNLKLLKEMYNAGVQMMAGSDFGALGILPGYSLVEEIQNFVNKLGATPREALLSATYYPAQYFNHNNPVEVLAPGRPADLVIYNENPLTRLDVLEQPFLVIHRGRVISK